MDLINKKSLYKKMYLVSEFKYNSLIENSKNGESGNANQVSKIKLGDVVIQRNDNSKKYDHNESFPQQISQPPIIINTSTLSRDKEDIKSPLPSQITVTKDDKVNTPKIISPQIIKVPTHTGSTFAQSTPALTTPVSTLPISNQNLNLPTDYSSSSYTETIPSEYSSTSSGDQADVSGLEDEVDTRPPNQVVATQTDSTPNVPAQSNVTPTQPFVSAQAAATQQLQQAQAAAAQQQENVIQSIQPVQSTPQPQLPNQNYLLNQFEFYQNLLDESLERNNAQRNQVLQEEQKDRDKQWIVEMGKVYDQYKRSLNIKDRENEEVRQRLRGMEENFERLLNEVNVNPRRRPVNPVRTQNDNQVRELVRDRASDISPTIQRAMSMSDISPTTQRQRSMSMTSSPSVREVASKKRKKIKVKKQSPPGSENESTKNIPSNSNIDQAIKRERISRSNQNDVITTKKEVKKEGKKEVKKEDVKDKPYLSSRKLRNRIQRMKKESSTPKKQKLKKRIRDLKRENASIKKETGAKPKINKKSISPGKPKVDSTELNQIMKQAVADIISSQPSSSSGKIDKSAMKKAIQDVLKFQSDSNNKKIEKNDKEVEKLTSKYVKKINPGSRPNVDTKYQKPVIGKKRTRLRSSSSAESSAAKKKQLQLRKKNPSKKWSGKTVKKKVKFSEEALGKIPKLRYVPRSGIYDYVSTTSESDKYADAEDD